MNRTSRIVVGIALAGLCLLALFSLMSYSAECMWTGRIMTWEDRNGDGIWNRNESPLADIPVHLRFRQANLTEITNSEGIANMALRYGCELSELREFRLGVEAPPGYKLTTPSEQQVPLDKSGEQPILFGLKKEK